MVQTCHLSPHVPQSNGFAESLVCTAETTLKKCTLGKSDLDLAFLLFFSKPEYNILPSPAELLCNRYVRSVLSSATKCRPDLEITKSVLAQMQANMEDYYDHGTKELAPLKLDDTVMVQSDVLDLSPVTATERTMIIHSTNHRRSVL